MEFRPGKRQLSPASLPPSKRQHGVCTPSARGILTSFDNALYDELILFIFSFLNSRDLCTMQAANKNCSRLACDKQVISYTLPQEETDVEHWGCDTFCVDLEDNVCQRLWQSGPSSRREGVLRPSRRSRSKATSFPCISTDRRQSQLEVDVSHKLKLEKWWASSRRLLSQWLSHPHHKGRCAVESLSEGVPMTQPTSQSVVVEEPSFSSSRSHVLLAGSLTISASSEMSHQPTILLRARPDLVTSIKCRSSTSSTPVGISTVAIDQSPPSSRASKPDSVVRFSAFLSTGEFNIYEYDPLSPSTSPKLAYIPLPRHRNHVMQAAYHHPLLVTLSHTFTLMVFDLGGDTVTHTHSLSSFTSHPPTSLILSAMPSSSSYKLILAYAIPVYPAHWSVGVTELIISTSGSVTSTTTFSGNTGAIPLSPSNFTVTRTRSARAFDVPQGWIDDEKLKSMREQWGRKVKHVADTQTDGKWVVLAPGDSSKLPIHWSHDGGSSSDASSSSSSSPSSTPFVSPPSHTSTQLQLYRLYMPLSSSSPRLSFVRTLHGPLGPVSALSLADGRCVSLGVNGSIWVWDLEGGDGIEVARPVDGFERASGRGTVVFDERRIVTCGIRGVEERRFDI